MPACGTARGHCCPEQRAPPGKSAGRPPGGCAYPWHRMDTLPPSSPALVIRYPQELPVTQRKDEILAAIRDHQVVIVSGETGSGKTTQLPKICLELGRGTDGRRIGHTQPRRIAARTVAERIAAELGTQLGELVGYQVRFTDRVGADSRIKIMTDGILLAELSGDRGLKRYDTLIIDEAHERSLNIDFILGYLKQLLPSRPDLKVIITSATIDSERFSQHFGGAPVLEVTGRTYPVEVRYRPYLEDPDCDQSEAIRAAVEELQAEGPGDILVFLSGEREIRETAETLAGAKLRNTEILPLYARLSVAEQHRVFAQHPGRRVVLATNVAETSLTVPGIRYVVDAGMARISRYSRRLKVQRLPVEPISQASANQRAGRCGRVADGICIRLYDETDFATRPEYTDPEILRTNLASVVLQMTAIDLGDLEAFPFIDPPDRAAIADGIRLLEELGAFGQKMAGQRRLTPIGRRLARLPLDPRLARMVVEAETNGCLADVLVIVAALSIQDPRERPADQRPAADAVHARFTNPESDFFSYLNVWEYLAERQRALSSNQFRRLCRAEFLNYLRVREWQDLHAQVRQIVGGRKVPPLAPLRGPESAGAGPAAEAAVAAPDPERLRTVHCSLLAGLLSHLGVRDVEKRDYLGARGARFSVFPASALFKKQPRWVMAAELVETSRLWARVVGRIEPEWVEPVAGHLVKRSYSEPHWSKRQAAVMAYEKVTLYGLPLVTKRLVNFGRIDPVGSRDLFIRHALVEGDWETRHRFFHDNRALLAEVEELEHRARRRDIVVDDETLVEFYDQRLPDDIVSGRHFDAWWKRASRATPDLLTFDRSTVINERSHAVSAEAYPDGWGHDGVRLPLTYRFVPGEAGDGVTVRLPLPLLGQVTGEDFAWQVPGLREELVTALIRSLPKDLRRNFVPVPDYVQAVLPRLHPGRGTSLLAELERQLHELSGVWVPREAWQLDRIPQHLTMTFQIVDEHDRSLGEGKDLEALRQALDGEVRAAFTAAGADIERTGVRSWTIGQLAREVVLRHPVPGGRAGDPVCAVKGYPALVDEGASVAVRVLETEEAQQEAMIAGTRRLLALTVGSPVKLVNAQLTNQAKLILSRNPHRSAADLMEDCVACAIDAIVEANGGPAWDEAGFAALRFATTTHLRSTVLSVVEYVQRILALAHPVRQRLARPVAPAAAPAVADMRQQLDRLVHRGFVMETGWKNLPHLPRYLQAIDHRLDRCAGDTQRDADRMARIAEVWQEYQDLLAKAGGGQHRRRVEELRWMIEEFRVSLFAQTLGTAYPISEKRIYRAMDELDS
ncbi:MAG: ATP-dependent RNA helicase HrpA [Micromonosporaceae bacterium]|nr:ATP-dependent RNA helicase HrpA [Micromonosporaceae bacterium]